MKLDRVSLNMDYLIAMIVKYGVYDRATEAEKTELRRIRMEHIQYAVERAGTPPRERDICESQEQER